MITKPKIGTEVWYKSTWCDVNSGVITGFHNKHPDYVTIKGIRDTYGTQNCLISNCYSTKQALLDALHNESQNNIASICNEIKTVEDLIRYMYNHTVSCAEEYTNWDARKAVSIRANELLGIQLE